MVVASAGRLRQAARAPWRAAPDLPCLRMEFVLPTPERLRETAQLVRQSVEPTPAFSHDACDALVGHPVIVKNEGAAPTGSFKVRGALNYIARLVESGAECESVVCASRGNFGQAVAFAAAKHNLRCRVVVPLDNTAYKNEAMRKLGAELIEHGADFSAALERAGYGERLTVPWDALLAAEA